MNLRHSIMTKESKDTPQQNGISERRNRSILDYARTLMIEKKVSLKYWREVVSTTIYTLNQVQVKKGTNSTPFELQFGYPPNVKYFKIFGSKCYILKDDRHEKFDAKSDEGIFLGYSTRSKAYKCLNVNTYKVVESANVFLMNLQKNMMLNQVRNMTIIDPSYTFMMESQIMKLL